MNTCPHCQAPARNDWPSEFLCGSVTHSVGEFYRSNRCFGNEIAQLRDQVAALTDTIRRLEQAGDLLAEWHLAVVTTVEKAERDVARWNEAKGAKP